MMQPPNWNIGVPTAGMYPIYAQYNLMPNGLTFPRKPPKPLPYEGPIP